MSDTPRTDEATYKEPHKGKLGIDMCIALSVCSADLERENQRLRTALAEKGEELRRAEEVVRDNMNVLYYMKGVGKSLSKKKKWPGPTGHDMLERAEVGIDHARNWLAGRGE